MNFNKRELRESIIAIILSMFIFLVTNIIISYIPRKVVVTVVNAEEIKPEITIDIPETTEMVEETECTCIPETTEMVEETESKAEPASIEPETTETLPKSEYDTASYIYNNLLDMNITEEAAAGIMGNIMAECGGQSLELNPFVGNSYYGICQWSSYYYPDVKGASLDGQIDFLGKTIESTMGGSYNEFATSTSPRDAALIFAKYYERCSSESYGVRQNNAEKAYDYFKTHA